MEVSYHLASNGCSETLRDIRPVGTGSPKLDKDSETETIHLLSRTVLLTARQHYSCRDG